MDFINLLDAPVPFLEQQEYDFSLQDENGYTALHYAALTLKFSWLLNALSNDPDKMTKYLSKNTNTSEIKVEIIPPLNAWGNNKSFDKRKKDKETNNVKTYKTQIPFGEKGYTVLHLLIWILFKYEQEDHINKKDATDKITEVIQDIINKNVNALKIKDGNGYSVLEYALLLNQEHILSPFIQTISQSDFCPNIKTETLEKITEQTEAKNKNKEARIHLTQAILKIRSYDKIVTEISNHQTETEDSTDFKL